MPTKSFLILCTQSRCRYTQESRKILTKVYVESCREVGENVWEGEKNSTSRTRKGRGCFHKTLNVLKFHPDVAGHHETAPEDCIRALLPSERSAQSSASARTTESNPECNPSPLGKPVICFALSSAISSVLIIEQQAGSGTNQCTWCDEDANCERETESLLKLDNKS